MFPKYKCVGNWVMKPLLRLALGKIRVCLVAPVKFLEAQ
jgi:hypothetical protein